MDGTSVACIHKLERWNEEHYNNTNDAILRQRVQSYKVPLSNAIANTVAYGMPLSNTIAFRMSNAVSDTVAYRTLVDTFSQSMLLSPRESRENYSTYHFPKPIYGVDQLLAKDIAIGAGWLLNDGYKSDTFCKSIRSIEENKVYNSNILFNDLKDIEEIKGLEYTFKELRDIIDFSKEVDIDAFFDTILNITPDQVPVHLGDYAFFHDVYHLIAERKCIEHHLKLKALKRFIDSELQRIINHEQTHSFLNSPLILHLREYLDNIFNIKKIYLLTLLCKITCELVDKIFLNINTNGNTIRYRFITLSS
jgi:hypothetical protein